MKGTTLARMCVMTAPGISPAYRSLAFLLDEGSVITLDHDTYVQLAQGQKSWPRMANRRVRLADWYVEVLKGQDLRRVSEWYGWVCFDAEGRLELAPDKPAIIGPDNVDPPRCPRRMKSSACTDACPKRTATRKAPHDAALAGSG
ncbi:hypothetical protein [Azohydromonas australica]|uniref:hypothetical protein n=1 Tax=Azohydromonas australica TaxID=364039 RepID=UPI0012EB8F4A|nr:hypothetical protein [Azohydromonas australica]